MNLGSNPRRGKRFISSPKCHDWLWDALTFCSVGSGGPFPQELERPEPDTTPPYALFFCPEAAFCYVGCHSNRTVAVKCSGVCCVGVLIISENYLIMPLPVGSLAVLV